MCRLGKVAYVLAKQAYYRMSHILLIGTFKDNHIRTRELCQWLRVNSMEGSSQTVIPLQGMQYSHMYFTGSNTYEHTHIFYEYVQLHYL